MGGSVNGLAATVTCGTVGGIGGNVSGLAAAVTCGTVGGIGGNVSGLAAAVTCGTVGGIGGNVSGLAAAVTCGTVGGIGGNVSGLATARLATATIPAAKTKVRTFRELAVMNVHSLTTKGTMQRKSNSKVSCVLQQK
jgi:hypothetical protein